MEAAGYPPTTCLVLIMFINRLPINIVSYITLYNNIMISLNEPDRFLLPNIHHLFNHVTRLDGNINHSRMLNHDPCNHQQTNQPVIALTSATTVTLVAADSTTGITQKYGNCGWTGHTDETCFQ
jgi:hypothetical protein